MPLLFALTVSIGLLAVVATWLFLGPLAALGVQIWQAFVAWASFYNNGGKTEGATKTAVCMTFGAVVGHARLVLDKAPHLEELTIVWKQDKTTGRGHFSHRLAFAACAPVTGMTVIVSPRCKSTASVPSASRLLP